MARAAAFVILLHAREPNLSGGFCPLFFQILESGVPNLSVANPLWLASSAFDLLSVFLLQDEAVEPYLQRHRYTFEVQERVMPGWTKRAPLLLTQYPELT